VIEFLYYRRKRGEEKLAGKRLKCPIISQKTRKTRIGTTPHTD
jgi:hypothetical protein